MSAGIASPATVTVETRGVANVFSNAALAGIAAIGAATGIPIPFTSWQVEHRPKLRTASENKSRPRAASAANAGAAEVTGAFAAIDGFAMPFNRARYADTAAKSARDSVVAYAAIAVLGMPRATVLL